MYRKWCELQALGLNICEYFRIKKYNYVVIYGTGEINMYLQKELEESNILFSVNNNYEKADVIVVTEDEKYFDIEKKFCESRLVEVISISELIEKIYNNRNVIKNKKR